MMPDFIETGSIIEKPVKILIIDDEPIFHGLIGSHAEMLGYHWQSANNIEEAMLAIKEAEENDNPFSLVTIDMKFDVGKSEMLIGKMILQKIKSRYANIGCIIISGSGLSPHEVLDLRDTYGLDYYILKDRLDPDTLDKGIKRALERVSPLASEDKRRQLLTETRERYKDICAVYASNLAKVEEKKAQIGIDVSVNIENQIEFYREKLREAQNRVKAINEELEQLNAA